MVFELFVAASLLLDDTTVASVPVISLSGKLLYLIHCGSVGLTANLSKSTIRSMRPFPVGTFI